MTCLGGLKPMSHEQISYNRVIRSVLHLDPTSYQTEITGTMIRNSRNIKQKRKKKKKKSVTKKKCEFYFISDKA